MKKYLLLGCLFLVGCGLGKGSNSLVDKVTPVIRDMGNTTISSSTITGIQNPYVVGIDMGSMTIRNSAWATINVKALDKFNKPVIQVDRMEIVLWKKYPGDCSYKKVVRAYEGKILKSEEIETADPVKMKDNSKWMILLGLILGVILTLIIGRFYARKT